MALCVGKMLKVKRAIPLNLHPLLAPVSPQPYQTFIWNPISLMTCLGAVAGPHVVGMPHPDNPPTTAVQPQPWRLHLSASQYPLPVTCHSPPH